MTIALTEQQQRIFDAAGTVLPQIVDPRTNQTFVLIPAAEYESVRELIEEERRQKVISAIALRNAAGRLGELQTQSQ